MILSILLFDSKRSKYSLLKYIFPLLITNPVMSFGNWIKQILISLKKFFILFDISSTIISLNLFGNCIFNISIYKVVKGFFVIKFKI